MLFSESGQSLVNLITYNLDPKILGHPSTLAKCQYMKQLPDFMISLYAYGIHSLMIMIPATISAAKVSDSCQLTQTQGKPQVSQVTSFGLQEHPIGLTVTSPSLK